MTFGVARRALPGMLGFDALELMPLEVLRAARAEGFTWIGTYLEAMTPAYADDCFAADLMVLPICEARISPLSADVGAEDAAREVGRCDALAMARGVSVVIDFERPSGTPADCSTYLRHFARGLVLGGELAALYVAPPQPLTGQELYIEQPDVHLYFHGGGVVPDVPCGYSIFQGLPIDYVAPWSGGRAVDLDIIFADRRGRLPVLWARS